MQISAHLKVPFNKPSKALDNANVLLNISWKVHQLEQFRFQCKMVLEILTMNSFSSNFLWVYHRRVHCFCQAKSIDHTYHPSKTYSLHIHTVANNARLHSQSPVTKSKHFSSAVVWTETVNCPYVSQHHNSKTVLTCFYHGRVEVDQGNWIAWLKSQLQEPLAYPPATDTSRMYVS